MTYTTGDIVKVTVTNIEDYGIFVKVDELYNGLIHISEITNKFVSNIKNYAYVGETIYAKIINVDEKNNQLKLSIKSINYRTINRKGNILESPEGFNTLAEMLPIWIDKKLKEINAN